MKRALMKKLSPLSRAAIRWGDFDESELSDVAKHGVDTGWPGFTSYTDTVAWQE